MELVGLIMVLIMGALLLGLIPALIARGKGRDFATWWTYGAALFIVALPHAFLIAPDRAALGQRKCPFCAEYVKRAARVCRYCGRDLPESSRAASETLCVVCSRPEDAHQHWCSRGKE